MIQFTNIQTLKSLPQQRQQQQKELEKRCFKATKYNVQKNF